jgi:hypothetical protein
MPYKTYFERLSDTLIRLNNIAKTLNGNGETKPKVSDIENGEIKLYKKGALWQK